MEKEQFKKELTARNVETLDDKVKFLNDKIFEALIVISEQQQAIAGLINRMNLLSQQLNVQKVQVVGLGPSVK